MADLSQQEVLALAKIGRITVIPKDLEEVTLRLNALLEALSVLDTLPLDNVPAVPAVPHPQALP